MTYNKPEITILGDAIWVVQGPKPDGYPDGGYNTAPAYELDGEE